MSKPQPDREFFETGGEPEFYVTDTKIEQAGAGNLRIYCYHERRGVLHLLYTVVCPASALASMARRSLEASSEAHNLEIFAKDFH